jgi:hypothetical protein
VMAALFTMRATNLYLIFNFSLYTSLFIHPHTQKSDLYAPNSNICIFTSIENWTHVYIHLYTRNSPHYHLLKYLLFLLKHPVYIYIYIYIHVYFRGQPQTAPSLSTKLYPKPFTTPWLSKENSRNGLWLATHFYPNSVVLTKVHFPAKALTSVSQAVPCEHLREKIPVQSHT